MEVDQGSTWQAGSLSPPLVLCVSGKRRRLNDTADEDSRELAQLLLEEDGGTVQNPVPTPTTASAHPASVLSVYAHNAQHFACTLRVYSAVSFAFLRRHRDSRHQHTAFLDRFSAGCACGVPFASRLAAAHHAEACAGLRTHTSATASAVGEFSPTAIAVNATATVVGLPTRLPLPDSSVLAVSPPHMRVPLLASYRYHDGVPRFQGR
ncbi:unnamed protein product [Peronospora destructor]|nr:unnamed protein product [Peronospora destructor]